MGGEYTKNGWWHSPGQCVVPHQQEENAWYQMAPYVDSLIFVMKKCCENGQGRGVKQLPMVKRWGLHKAVTYCGTTACVAMCLLVSPVDGIFVYCYYTHRLRGWYWPSWCVVGGYVYIRGYCCWLWAMCYCCECIRTIYSDSIQTTTEVIFFLHPPYDAHHNSFPNLLQPIQ